MAIVHHAVNRSEIAKKAAAIVIDRPRRPRRHRLLRTRRIETIVASDLSPGRRALAVACGASLVVDAAEDDVDDRRGHAFDERRRHALRSDRW